MPHTAVSTCRFESLESRRLLASTITGVVFNDTNGDGIRFSGEPLLANQTVFLDMNFNGRRDAGEPTRTTNAQGVYSFTNLRAGVYRVFVIVPAGFRQTRPGSRAFYDVAANGIDSRHTRIDFGLSTTALVRGTVFNDLDRDGVRDIGESGVFNARVFIDRNNNGRLDRNEIYRLTDRNGNYAIALRPGTYSIRVVNPAGTVVTTPPAKVYRLTLAAAQVVTARNFGLDS
ncbi:MAG TPA: SdrD B-like domain-containing protein [Tepidisphaeraceae bacterium]|nr:SdrD B-like domain-containing protein [Tepidisphaeraceae bacterium]